MPAKCRAKASRNWLHRFIVDVSWAGTAYSVQNPPRKSRRVLFFRFNFLLRISL